MSSGVVYARPRANPLWQVEFADTPKGVRVRVTFDSEPTHSIEQQRDGWQAILNNFTRHVEASR